MLGGCLAVFLCLISHEGINTLQVVNRSHPQEGVKGQSRRSVFAHRQAKVVRHNLYVCVSVLLKKLPGYFRPGGYRVVKWRFRQDRQNANEARIPRRADIGFVGFEIEVSPKDDGGKEGDDEKGCHFERFLKAGLSFSESLTC
jgi:hypothetical protein